jgi:hypothetical protein
VVWLRREIGVGAKVEPTGGQVNLVADLQGRGSTDAEPVVTRNFSVVLTGRGTKDGTPDVTRFFALDLTGRGASDAQAARTAGLLADVEGRGEGSAVFDLTRFMYADLQARGWTDTAITVGAFVELTIDLSGRAHLSPDPLRQTHAMDALLDGRGATGAVFDVTRFFQTDVQGRAAAESSLAVTRFFDAVVQGRGALYGAVQLAGEVFLDADLTGRGMTSTGTVDVVRWLSALIEGTSATDAEPTRTRLFESILEGRGTTVGRADATRFIEALLAGRGEGAATPDVTRHLLVDVQGRAQALTEASATRFLSSVVSGRAEVFAIVSLVGEILLTAVLTGSGALLSAPSMTRSLTTKLSGKSHLDALVQPTRLISALLSGRGATSAAVGGVVDLLVDLRGRGALDSVPVPTRQLLAALAGRADLTGGMARTRGLELTVRGQASASSLLSATRFMTALIEGQASTGITISRDIDLAADLRGIASVLSILSGRDVPSDTPLDERLVPLVQNLLDRLGKDGTITEETGGYDPATGTIGGDTNVEPGKFTPPMPWEKFFDAGDNRRRGMLRTFVAAKDLIFAPADGMILTLDAIKYRIVSVEPVHSGERVVLYGLVVEGDGTLVPSSSETTLDERLIPAAQSILDRFGKQVSFIVPTSPSYDPGTGVLTQGATQTKTTKMTPPEPYESKYVDGDIIRKGDLRAYIAAQDLDFQPERAHLVTLDTEDTRWYVVRANPVYSGQKAVLWEVQLRR